jgi:hypothetical protein
MGKQFRWIALAALATCCPLIAQAQGNFRVESSSFNSALNLQGGVFNRDAFLLPDYGPKALRNATDIYNALRPTWQGTFRYSQAGVEGDGSPVSLTLTDKVQIGQVVLVRGQISLGLTRAEIFGSINGATGQVELFKRNPNGAEAAQLNTDGRYVGFLRDTSRIPFVGEVNRPAVRETEKPEILLYWVPDRLTIPTGEVLLTA